MMRAGRKAEDGNHTREALLDAAEAIMIEDGYAAVTSRRIEERAGLKSQLVHYHFGTMDDLFVALYERHEQAFLRRHRQAAEAENPLRAVWELSISPKRTRLAQELIALSNHRKPIRKITARILERMHSVNISCIEKYFREAGIDPAAFPPVVISHLVTGLSRQVVTEAAAGFTAGHADVLAFVERMLDEIEAKHARQVPVSAPPPDIGGLLIAQG